MPIAEYRATAYRQAQDPASPWIITFVATAEDVLTWAAIPQREEDSLQGFQRTADPNRIARAKEYFEQPENQSPTALVVGLHPRLEGVDAVRATVEFDDPDESKLIRHCTLRVQTLDSAVPLAEVVDLVRRQLIRRLESDGTEPEADDELEQALLEETLAGEAGQDSGEDQMAGDEGQSEVDEESVEAAEEDGEIELGRSILKDLLRRLGDAAWCSANEEAIRELAKPATLIDGQHRAKGAQACERNIPFTVCAMLECPWPEQVFQFTVINYTAKGIPDQFITANAALSLTRSELEFLGTRLEQAKVRVTEYELMKFVNFDKVSPFYQLIDLSERRDPTRIGYKTMVKVAKRWYDAKHPVFAQILANAYPHITGRNKKTARLRQWQRSGDWGLFFQDFWNAVYKVYGSQPSHETGSSLWDVGHSQLMNAVVLMQLQEAYLMNLNAQDEEFFKTDASGNARDEMREILSKRTTKFTEFVPAQFFATKWGWTSLNTGPGRDVLEAALRQFVERKGNFRYHNAPLITGQA